MQRIASSWRLILFVDSVGLGLFAAVGAEKAFVAGLGPVGIMVIATIASVGGVVLRDIITREIPSIFTRTSMPLLRSPGGWFTGFSHGCMPPGGSRFMPR
ncbi:trimeric intracellular cation channel family protein [Candidatus Latescibacterota bacterium]